jgi:alginate O-acetyltransferase complex protein AlgI
VTRAVERRGETSGAKKSLFPAPIGVFFTFHYVCLAWVFFRAPTFEVAVRVLRQITTATTFHPNLPPIVAFLLVLALATHFTPKSIYDAARARFSLMPAPAQGLLLFMVAVVLHEAAGVNAVPFVYFQF